MVAVGPSNIASLQYQSPVLQVHKAVTSVFVLYVSVGIMNVEYESSSAFIRVKTDACKR